MNLDKKLKLIVKLGSLSMVLCGALGMSFSNQAFAQTRDDDPLITPIPYVSTTPTPTPNSNTVVNTTPNINRPSGGSQNNNSPVNARPNTNIQSGDLPIPTIINPTRVNTIPELTSKVIRILFGLIAMVAVVVIIVAGFRMVAFGAEPAARKKAKDAIFWAVIGLVVALVSFSIVGILQKLIAP